MFSGNRKGMEHFVKYLSAMCLNPRKIKTYLLDMDQTGYSNDDGVKAIVHALKKVGVHGEEGDRFKLWGSTTVSGGAQTLEQLGNALMEANVGINMLIANCGLHNTQLQLSNGTEKYLGLGGLKKRNVMQILHSMYDLKESMPSVLFWDCVAYGAELSNDRLNGGPPEILSLELALHEYNVKKYKNNTKKYKKKFDKNVIDPCLVP
jgi:hypothetical protein